MRISRLNPATSDIVCGVTPVIFLGVLCCTPRNVKGSSAILPGDPVSSTARLSPIGTRICPCSLIIAIVSMGPLSVKALFTGSILPKIEVLWVLAQLRPVWSTPVGRSPEYPCCVSRAPQARTISKTPHGTSHDPRIRTKGDAQTRHTTFQEG
ncbi:MAG: hypothetical protein BWX93_01990 [Bacteroidetes bacterium ADurb.Bin139]|nr:MAG: hypothetical protein BWX93_01990 [Bacteroidetes bacterium ADurb.Bin139]